jgi:hypothetical protein
LATGRPEGRTASRPLGTLSGAAGHRAGRKEETLELNDYSTRFLSVLLATFPEFRDRMTAGPDLGCFTVAFPAPSGALFLVGTLEEESITVGFDVHHVHFGGWAESVDRRDFAAAVEYVGKLMDGQYEVAVWERDGQFAGSVTVERGEEPRPPAGEGLTYTLRRWQEAGAPGGEGRSPEEAP